MTISLPPAAQRITDLHFLPPRIRREGGKEYKKMGQKEVELTECSLKIVSCDRAVVVKLN